MMAVVALELPIAHSGAVRERADAARNRQRILDAAARLVRERGIESVSMDDVATAAQVGTGTLYRRFGDRAGLAIALLDDQTRAFQDALIAGPPPLGPGAPARERLLAFGEAYLGLLERHAELMMAGAPFGLEPSGVQSFYLTHLALLLREAAPHLDGPFVAESLLATLSPGHFLWMRRGQEWSTDRLQAGWHALVDALTKA